MTQHCRRGRSTPTHGGRPTDPKLEEFAYDPLGRLKTATTRLSNIASRTLSHTYDANGNLKSKTSSVNADMGATSYTYGAGTAGPHAVTGATIVLAQSRNVPFLQF